MQGAVKIILSNEENKVLLQLRDKHHSHTGRWSLFGGHIDGEETPEEALAREIKEEINYYKKIGISQRGRGGRIWKDLFFSWNDGCLNRSTYFAGVRGF